MTTPLDMDRQVVVPVDLATLLLFENVVSFSGYHDPILDHLTDQQQKALWAGSDILQRVLFTMGIENWDEALALAQETWDARRL